MLGIASYLNENLKFQYSPHNPILPASVDNQLTIPKTLQLAEYGKGDFYKAHSDNSIHNANTGQRRNFRCYTCISYCNDEWKYTDGGTQYIFLNSILSFFLRLFSTHISLSLGALRLQW